MNAFILIVALMSSLLTQSIRAESNTSQNLGIVSKPQLSVQFEIKPSSSSEPKTLRDAYLAALKRSETVGMQQELWLQADELQVQAKSAILPSVVGSGTYLHQPPPSSSIGSSVYPSEQTTVKLTADQPLFRGFRDFALLRQKREATDSQKYALLNAAKQLFYDLSLAYFNVLAFAQDEVNYKNEIEVNEKRLGELKEFLRIGRSRESELLTFKANIASLQALLEAVRTQLETAKDVLAFLCGWDRETVLKDNEMIPTTVADVKELLSHIEERPDVQTAYKNVIVYEEGIPLMRGQHLPSIDAIGDYYFTRPGTLADVHWDVSIALTMPLFQGGLVESQVRQAASAARQYTLQLSQTRRQAEQEIRTFFDAFRGDQKQMNRIAETFEISQKNYEVTNRDYRNGLVTNLDVLQAITTYQESQRMLDHQRYLVKLDAVKLQAATAQRPEIKIQVSNN